MADPHEHKPSLLRRLISLGTLPSRLTTYAVVIAVAAALGGLATLAAVRKFMNPSLPPATTHNYETRPTPTVLVSVRELSRLETAEFHMERVVEMTDRQTRLFGQVEARDRILLIAAGNVVAGVDFSRMVEGDVRAEPARGRVWLRLPAPEIFSSALDSQQTHVYERHTDELATPSPDLEERARREAESTMRRGAVEIGILERARGGAERSLRPLLRSLGFTDITIEWAAPTSPADAPTAARDG